MFSDAPTSGKHMICDIRNIQNTVLLNDVHALASMMKQICIDYKYTILGEISHVFRPEGCSLLLLLSESHMSIHTFPERRYIAFDIYTCRQYENNSDYVNIQEFLVQQFDAGVESTYCILEREF